MRNLILCIAVLMAAAAPCLVWAAEKPTPREAARDSVVVRQGDVSVTLADVDGVAAGMPADMRAGIFHNAERIKKILNNMLLTRQLANEARASGLADDPMVRAEVEIAVNRALAKARQEALQAKFAQEVPDQAALAHERYLADPGSFAVSKRVDVKHILISTDKRSDADAKALADKLLAELRVHPEQFDEDVDKYSDDPSKSRNFGLIRNALSDRLAEPFREASRALTHEGEIIGPVKTSFGYHLIKAISVEPAHKRSFDEVKPELVKTLGDRWVDQQIAQHLGELRARKIEVNDVLVRSLLKRYIPEGADWSIPPAPEPRVQRMSAKP